MRKLRKAILIGACACCLYGETAAADEVMGAVQLSTELASDVMRADVIGWVYKEINGKLYKRLYNYTKQEYVGEWILVG